MEPTDTVLSVKEQLAEQILSVETAQQILIFAGEVLEDTNSLQDYSIQKDSTLHLTTIKDLKITSFEITECVHTFENSICTHCGYECTHDFTDKVVSEDTLKTPADCENAAVYYYSCADCGKISDTLTFEDGESLGHKLTAHVEVAATCEKTGTKAYWSCDTYDKLFSDAEAKTEIEDVEVIAALGRDYSDDFVFDEEYHWHECVTESCEAVTEKIAHTFGEWTVDKEATVEETGI